LTDRGARYILHKISKKYGLRDLVHPHTLRHTFATNLLEEGANLREIQELLGHSSLRSTQIYTHVSPVMVKKLLRPCERRPKTNHECVFQKCWYPDYENKTLVRGSFMWMDKG